MKQPQSAALVLYENLPKDVRKVLGPTKARMIAGDMLAAEKIREAYQDSYAPFRKLFEWKKANGFCRGTVSCMHRPKPGERMCSSCRALHERYKRNAGTRARQLTPYAQWRSVQRAIERAERDRLLGESS